MSEQAISFVQLASVDGNLVMFFRNIVRDTLDELKRTSTSTAMSFATFHDAFARTWLTSIGDVQRYLPNLSMHLHRELKATLLAFMVWHQLSDAALPSHPPSKRVSTYGMLDDASGLPTIEALLKDDYLACCRITGELPTVRAFNTLWNSMITGQHDMSPYLERLP
ncbi:hypothetical protein AURDEDRAFT_169284 [Auricularia subglabra TFB-10046 SS5]|nr:hypothetical protein AURDEDRAFT_169284 [Auricularia subglabra TFB-10046 SS5]